MKFKSYFLPLQIMFFLLVSALSYAQQTGNVEFDIRLENWAYFQKNKSYDRAIDQIEQGFEIADKADNKLLSAIALNRMGRSLMKIDKRVNKNRKEAMEKFEESLLYLTGAENSELRINNLENLIWLASKEGNQDKVARYQSQIDAVMKRSAAVVENEILAERVDSLEIKKEILSKKVATLSADKLQSELVIALQKNQVDSLAYKQTTDSFLLEQKEYMLAEQATTMSLQESEISLQKSQRNLLLALAAIIGFLAIGLIMRFMAMKRHNKILETKNDIIKEEKKRSDELLLNILPALVAKELKANGVAKAKKYEQASVLFTDFENFSGIAKKLSPEQLVYELDLHFKAFDDIIGKHHLEKIKTIGDAYMCVGGLPEERTGHTRDVIKAALEIQEFLSALKKERIKKKMPFFEARIGIHTGPLVAGVVGSKKFAYDIWGDTVNVAARLETNGQVGKVNISSSTYAIVKEEFSFEDRGKLPIKNMGEVGMYFVEK